MTGVQTCALPIWVRKGVSKLRGALEPLVLVNVSLVRGKEYWRITSAEALRAVSPKVTTLRPLALLEKLVQGEHVEPELFDVVEANLENDETLLVANIMHKLGYLRGEDLNLDQKALVQAINKGLELTHLT